MKKWKEVLMILGGSVVMGLSIDLFVRADLGLDPLSLFQAGLGRVSGLSLGTVSQLLMIFMILLLLLLDRKRIGLGSVLNSVLVGMSINLFSPVVGAGAQTMVERGLCLLAGLILMGVGIGTYVAAGLGEAGMDAMMMYLSNRLKKNVNGTRVGLDLLLSAAGFLLGGKAGIATILSMAVNGYVIQKTIEVIEGMRKRPLQEQEKGDFV